MTTLHDLRFAWLDTLSRAGNTAGRDEDGDGTPDPDDSPPADDLPDEDDDQDDETVSHPRIKKLSEEAKRHRLAAKAEKERADRADAALAEAQGADQVRALRLELAAIKHNATRPEPFKDVEAAMAMVDLSAVTLGDDGTVSGLDDALDYVAKKYPYMVDDSGTAPARPAADDLPMRPSGRQTNGRRGDGSGYNRSTLEGKFPALRRRR
jgi:hypothetical protein